MGSNPTRAAFFPFSALKVTIIRQHLKSNKHTLGKERLQRKDGQEKDIAEAFATYNEKEHIAGETLSKNTQVYRIKVVSTFLKAGVPLNKLDTFRELLEENGPRLAGRRSLSDLIPFIREREVSKGGNICPSSTTRLEQELSWAVCETELL